MGVGSLGCLQGLQAGTRSVVEGGRGTGYGDTNRKKTVIEDDLKTNTGVQEKKKKNQLQRDRFCCRSI